MYNDPLVRGEKVYLRAFERSDLEAYREYVTSADARRAGYELPVGADQVNDWYDALRVKHGK